jgi:hypothetical protein
LRPASGKPSPASRAAVLEIGFAAACAFQILLHVSGTNAPDPQLSIVSVVLHDMNEADHARLAHLAKVVLFVELLDVNTTPTAVRYARLRPLSCGGGFSVFIHVQPFHRSKSPPSWRAPWPRQSTQDDTPVRELGPEPTAL